MSKSTHGKDTQHTSQQRPDGAAEARAYGQEAAGQRAQPTGDAHSRAQSPDANATGKATSATDKAASGNESSAQSGTAGQVKDDISIQEVIDTFSDLIAAKKLQWQAQWALVVAETRLLRQSLFVTVLATLATFAFCLVCWLIVNVAAAVMLSNSGMQPAFVALILLGVNGLLMGVAWRTARSAFKHLTLTPLINAGRGEPESPGSARDAQAPESRP
ncbi:hypothetical protein [Alteromonas gilva]|uniref:Phage holin family protein n=1 Tax=Alteromonas gilva TaxID=2987522 RepID=A0ABT5KZH5_9ALTE|nr:hypothetical protein [Alteromonas gilva]MDC8830172.1 hypothetical protein [Alteromonas gilva]